MQSVDIRTLVLIACAAATATAMIFLVVGTPRRRAAPELRLWAAAFAFKGAGLALIELRGHVPLVISLPLANLLIVTATQLLLAGLDRFAGVHRPGAHAAYLALAAVTLLASYHVGYQAISTAISFLIAGVIAACLVRVIGLRRPGLRSERWVLGVMFGQEIVLLCARGVVAASGHGTPTLFTPDAGTVLLYFTLILAPLMVGPALLALVTRREQLEKERLIGELTTTLDEVRTLRGLLPICAACKKIRDDDAGTWTSVESYVTHHSHAQFTHSICPACEARLYPDE